VGLIAGQRVGAAGFAETLEQGSSLASTKITSQLSPVCWMCEQLRKGGKVIVQIARIDATAMVS
jgi:hypothetical protein